VDLNGCQTDAEVKEEVCSDDDVTSVEETSATVDYGQQGARQMAPLSKSRYRLNPIRFGCNESSMVAA
jgi:hypothetical protein